MVQYTLADFNNVKNAGFDFQLPAEVITTLRGLHRNFKPNVDAIRQLNFKKTKLDFTKPTAIIREEVKVNPFTSIKLLLNKVSPKNYFECIDKLTEMTTPFTEEQEFQKVAELVFETASTNRFYTSIYADIYSHLMTINPTISSEFYKFYETFYGTFLARFDAIVYVDPNTDYDQYCVMNTANEKRKAISTFIGCLMKNGTVPGEHVASILATLLDKTETYIKETDKVNEVDEIVENINCVYSPPHHFDMFHPKLQQLSTIKYKQFPSLSSKTLFKLQDIAKKTKAPK